MFPDLEPVACATFEDALAAVKSGDARYAMIPIENSVAGRVADIHHLLPGAGLHIVGEHFLRVRHQLHGAAGRVAAHRQAGAVAHPGAGPMPQHAAQARAQADPRGRYGRLRAHRGRGQQPELAAIATTLAAEIYGLKILMHDIEDEKHNTTRFVILADEPGRRQAPATGPIVTTFLFRVRNVPAALYKAMGGFATNGVNMTKLESYQLDGRFVATMFYADIEGHPHDPPVARALEELSFFCTELKILGAYRASPFRREVAQRQAVED